MIASHTSIVTPFMLALCALAFVFPQRGAADDGIQFSRSSCASEAQAQPAPSEKKGADAYARDVTKHGKQVIIAKELGDAVRQDNRIVLSNVAVKSRLDKEGELRAYELVQVDKGSIVAKMGFKPGDLLTGINGIRAHDLYDRRQSLEKSNRFTVTIIRKGKPEKVIVEIK